MSPFDSAVALILKHEGGYVNDPKDPGGETNFGISKRSYPNVDIKGLTVDGAKAIYKKDYWDACKGDQLPPAVALCVFDAAVNQGVAWASKTLQRLVGAAQDGKIGNLTVAAVQKSSVPDIVNAYQSERIKHYVGLPTFPTFGKTWMRRVSETSFHAGRLA